MVKQIQMEGIATFLTMFGSRSLISFKHMMFFLCPFLDPHPTTYNHSNVTSGGRSREVTGLGTSYLPDWYVWFLLLSQCKLKMCLCLSVCRSFLGWHWQQVCERDHHAPLNRPHPHPSPSSSPPHWLAAAPPASAMDRAAGFRFWPHVWRELDKLTRHSAVWLTACMLTTSISGPSDKYCRSAVSTQGWLHWFPDEVREVG